MESEIMVRYHKTLISLLESLQQGDPTKPLRMAEIGVCTGFASAAMLKAFPPLHLIMVDAWKAAEPDSEYRKSGDGMSKMTQAEMDEKKQMAIDATAFAAERRTILQGPSVNMAWKIQDASQDLVFIDAEHTFSAVAADIAAWLPKVRPGGILCGHDYRHRRFVGVKQAVDQWAKLENRELRIMAGSVWATNV